MSKMETERLRLLGINGAVSADLLVPSRYDGHEVTSVGDGFAKDVSALRSVTISEGILSVGSKAFSGCGNLQSVSLPASLTTIYDRAFTVDGRIALEGKCQLQHISVASGNRCFQMNGSVLVDLSARSAILARRDALEVLLPDYVETIERRCFSGCGKLTEVIGGSGLRRISEEAFLFCRKLTAVQLMNTRLESVRKKAFSGCDSLASIEIPDSLSELSAHTFRWCNRLTKCIIHGNAPAVVLEQEEDGWGVAKDYVYVTSNANLDPSRFPWNDYYSGARVLGSVVTYVDPEAHGWGDVPGVWQGRPIRYIGMSPLDSPLELFPGEAVSFNTGLVGYTASGLPSGLRYDNATGMITGAATKPTAAEGVIVKFAKSGAEAEEMTIIVTELSKMTFDANGGTGTSMSPVQMASGRVYKLPKCTFTPPEGKTHFAGWACSNGRRYDDEMLVFNLGDVTMTAIWE